MNLYLTILNNAAEGMQNNLQQFVRFDHASALAYRTQHLLVLLSWHNRWIQYFQRMNVAVPARLARAVTRAALMLRTCKGRYRLCVCSHKQRHRRRTPSKSSSKISIQYNRNYL